MSNRPTVRPEQATDPASLADSLNTQVLTPLYARVEQLEKRAYFEVTITVKVSGTFPFQLPTPPFAVQALFIVNSWDLTNNTPANVGTPSYSISPTGKLLLQGALGLKAGQTFRLNFKAEG